MNILITGAKGQLGQEFKRLKDTFYGNIILTDLSEIDICSLENINNFLSGIQLDYIVNCAAYTNVRDAEIEREKSLLINSFGVKNLVDFCEKKKIKLIHISTDYVYNSKSIDPTDEISNIKPINYYGFSKREGEKYIEKSKSESIVIRTSWLYSKFGKNFVNTIIDKCVNKSENPNLDFITAGPVPPNPSELIISSRMKELLEKVKAEYDIVVIDNPPVGLVTDGIASIRIADYPIYIFRADYSKKHFVQNVDRLINENGIQKLSVILNGVDVERNKYGSYYGYGYGYGYGYAYGSGYGYGYYGSSDTKTSWWRRLINRIWKR